MQRTQYLGELGQDLAFTARQLVKNPGFAAVAVLTLALGIGATTAIFSAVYAVVLQPLPLRDPSRLMLVGEIWEGRPQSMSVGNYVDTNAAVPDFEHGLAAFNYANYNLADETAPERVVGARVTANYFEVMGVRPMLGRTFTADEDRPGNDRVVVLSHRLWTRRFGGSDGRGRPRAADERRGLPDRRRDAGVVRSHHRQRGTVDADRVHARAARDARRALPHRLRPAEAGRRRASRCRAKLDAVGRCASATISPKTTRPSASGRCRSSSSSSATYRQRLLTLLGGGRRSCC